MFYSTNRTVWADAISVRDLIGLHRNEVRCWGGSERGGATRHRNRNPLFPEESAFRLSAAVWLWSWWLDRGLRFMSLWAASDNMLSILYNMSKCRREPPPACGEMCGKMSFIKTNILSPSVTLSCIRMWFCASSPTLGCFCFLFIWFCCCCFWGERCRWGAGVLWCWNTL